MARLSWRPVGALILLLLCFLSIGRVAAGSVMAVDLGGEFLKVSLVRPGRPVSIAINEFSKRKSSAEVAFVKGARLTGDDAAALAPRYPELVVARARDLLGKLAKDSSLKQVQQDSTLQYKIVEDRARKTVSVAVGKEQYSAEELVGSLLHYAKGIAELATEGAAVLDCTIAVPPFFGPSQRQAVIDAAELAGLNVLALVNTHAAAALQFGYYRTFENKSETLLLYDLGSTSVSAALVKFSGLAVNGTGKSKITGLASKAPPTEGMEVLDVAWDTDIGVGQLDRLLIEHFATEFQQKHKKDLLASPKALAKLKRQVKRTKEILSANLQAPVNVEEIMDGIDFRSSITREEFERLAADFFQKAVAPAATLLERNGIDPKDLAAVELLGGGSRIPAVKAALSTALGGRSLDMHLDADEAVALGAGLVAANRSTTFRLRKFGVTDGAIYPITFQISPTKGIKAGSEGLLQPKALLPHNKRLPADRVAKLPNTTSDMLKFSLSFNESERHPLPPGYTKTLLADFEVSGIKSVVAKHKENGRMSVHFRADESGRLLPTVAEALVDVEEEYTIQVPILSTKAKDDNETLTAIEDDPAADQNETATEKNETSVPPATKSVTKTKRRTLKVPLNIGGPGFLQPGLTVEQCKASKAVLTKLAEADAARAETAAAKNDLEAYILATGDRLSSDETLSLVSTEKQREGLQRDLLATEDWLYMEGADEPGSVFRKRLADLSRVAKPIFERSKELSLRPAAVKSARGFLETLQKTVQSWDTIKPWLNATDKATLLSQAEEFSTWLHDAEERQAKLAGHDEPVLHSTEVDARTSPLRRQLTRLKNVKKPKPPPAPKLNTTELNATTAEEDAGTAKETDGLDEREQGPSAKAHASASADAHSEGRRQFSRLQSLMLMMSYSLCLAICFGLQVGCVHFVFRQELRI